MSPKCKFIQINLHQSTAATALHQKPITGETDIELTQKPWDYGDQIRGLCNRRGTLFSVGLSIASKSCILVMNNVQACLLLQLCSGDVTTVI